MHGLRVRCSFADLITPIAHLVAERYYWVLENVLFVHQSAAGRIFDEIEYDEATLQESNQLRLMDKKFFPKAAEFVQGDWDSIYGLMEPIDLATFKGFGEGNLPEDVEIYFSCTDAAYWEVYAKDEATLCLVNEVFPAAEECSLGEKRY
jgi:hypothetical protein